MQAIWGKLFEPSQIMRGQKLHGELPDSRSAYGRFFDLAWPTTVEMVLLTLVAMVDTYMVSSLGTQAIASVGLTNQPKFIVLALFRATSVGVTAIVARRRGENRPEEANACLRQSLVLVLCMVIVVVGIVSLFARELLTFAGAKPDTIEDAVAYYEIILMSMPFVVVMMTINAAQRGVGNTKISMTTNMVSNIVNVCFNYLLIGGNFGFPRLEVAGAAIATCIGSVAAACMALYSVLVPGRFLHLDFKKSFIPQKKTVQTLFSIGGSAAVEQLCMRIGFFMYAKIVAELGTVAFATHQVCSNVMHLSGAFGDGLSAGSTSLTGQSLGQKRPDLATLYVKIGNRFSIITSAILITFFVTCGRFVMALYSDDPYVIELGASLLLIVAAIVPAQNNQMLFAGCLRGAGDTKIVAISSFVSITVLRPIAAYLLCYPLGFGLFGAWSAMVLDQGARLLITSWRFRSGKWAHIEV